MIPVRKRYVLIFAAAVAVSAGLGLRWLLAHDDHDHGHGHGGGAGSGGGLDAPRVISDATRRTLGIRTAPVMKRTIEEILPVTGTVRAKPDLHVRLNAPVAGRVRELKAGVGHKITGGAAGDVLVVLDSIEAGRLQSSLIGQAERLRESKRHLAETEEVTRKLALAELTVLAAQLPVADDALRYAERAAELAARGGESIPLKEKLAADAERSKAAAAVKALEHRLSAYGVGPAALGKMRTVAGKADFSAMLQDGTLKWADVMVLGKPLELLDREHEQQELASDVSRLSREVRLLGFDEPTVQGLIDGKLAPQPILVRSPISGMVTVRSVAVGQSVQAEQTLLEVVDTGRLYVNADVPEAFIGQVIGRRSQAARVRTAVLPGVVIEGSVVHVSPDVRAESRTAHVVVEVANPDGNLLIGAFVEVSLVIREAKDAVTVPKDAVVRQGPMTFVWVEGRHHGQWEYQKRDVTVGASDDRYSEILAGDLAPGVHSVVSRGAYQLTLIPGEGEEAHAGHGHDHSH